MKRSRFTEEQIIRHLREAAALIDQRRAHYPMHGATTVFPQFAEGLLFVAGRSQ